MSYSLALALLGVATLVAAVLRSPRPHPRHGFILEMVARLASTEEADGPAVSGKRDGRQAA